VTAAVVLRAVLDHGPVARATVARVSGLSTAAVSRQLGELSGLGLVRERTARPGPRVGRPHVPVEIDTRRHVVCGVHIALYHWTVVVMDLRGRVIARCRTPHRDPDPAAVLAEIGTGVRTFLAQHARRRPLGVGVAVGGWVDPARRVVVRHTQLGWNEVAVGSALEELIGIPVRVESHSRALAQAEQLIGAHRTRARMSLVHLFVGNVVDAAIAIGDSVHLGPGSAAGDVSHLPVGEGVVLPRPLCACGRFGCVQASVADRVLTAHAAATGRIPHAAFEDVVSAVEAGQEWAVELFADRARLVGRAVATLLDVINPEILVVTEAGIARRPELLTVLHNEVAARSRVCPDPTRTVFAGSFGAQSLSVAAGAVVLHDTYAQPLAIRTGQRPSSRR
jgi:predicted NBD/HSP70 family sugar kinase